MRVRWRPEAQEDYRRARAWYARRSPASAIRLRDTVDRVLRVVAAHPEAFPERFGRLRSAPTGVFPYRILYAVEETCVAVYALFPTRSGRDPSRRDAGQAGG